MTNYILSRMDRYHLQLRDVKQVGQRDNKLFLELDLIGSIRFWFLRIKQKSHLSIELNPIYDHKRHILRVKDLDYKFQTANLLLKVFDRHYHEEFKIFLEEFIEISIKEDLFTARYHGTGRNEQVSK